MTKRIQIPDNTRFNYIELFNNFVELLLRSVYREHEHGIQSGVKLKENYFVTGLENKLQNIRRKRQDLHGRTNKIVLNNVIPVYFLPV